MELFVICLNSKPIIKLSFHLLLESIILKLLCMCVCKIVNSLLCYSSHFDSL